MPILREMTDIMLLEEKRVYFKRPGYPYLHGAATYQKIYFSTRCLPVH